MLQAFSTPPARPESSPTPAVSAAGKSLDSQQNNSFADTLQQTQQGSEDTVTAPEQSNPVLSDAGEHHPPAEEVSGDSAGNSLPVLAAEVAVSLPPVSGAAGAQQTKVTAASTSPAIALLNQAQVKPVLIGQHGAQNGGPVSVRAVDFDPVSTQILPILPQARAAEPALVSTQQSTLARWQLSSASAGVVTPANEQFSPVATGAVQEMTNSPSITKADLPPVEIPMSNARWSGAVAQRALVAIQQGLQQAEIRVTPAHLGPIEMHIQLQDERASVTMISPHAAVRELLEAATPRLRELLEQQGISLEQNLVSDHSAEQPGFSQSGDESSDNQAATQDDEQPLTAPHSSQVGLVDQYV